MTKSPREKQIGYSSLCCGDFASPFYLGIDNHKIVSNSKLTSTIHIHLGKGSFNLSIWFHITSINLNVVFRKLCTLTATAFLLDLCFPFRIKSFETPILVVTWIRRISRFGSYGSIQAISLELIFLKNNHTSWSEETGTSFRCIPQIHATCSPT